MALNIETKTIDGLQIRTQQLPALKSFALFGKLGKIFAPALAQATTLNLANIGEEDVAVLAPILGQVFTSLDPDDAAKIAQEILARTTVVVNNMNVELCNDGAIDSVFTGRFKTFLQTLLFALKVNYSDFFVDALDANMSGADEKEKESPSQST